MAFQLQVFGAAEEVTGSLYMIRTDEHTVLLECGLVQGGRAREARNEEPFPFDIANIDAVILSHAHIDHSGRIPLLVKRGYQGPIYAQNATRALCEIMLPDSGYINEKAAQWENKIRDRQGKPRVDPLYTRADGELCMSQFQGVRYEEAVEVAPELTLRFFDAGHILGSSIIELQHKIGTHSRTLIFSGDLGYRDAPVMNKPYRSRHADAVLMESTYGDRLHRPFAATISELSDVFTQARAARGNVLIPAFTVGRTQDLLYLMAENYDDWQLGNWNIYLDSPMGIRATEAYAKYRHLYGVNLFDPNSHLPNLNNFHTSLTTEESMAINEIRSGAVIIAGSGMCSGGRIHHHLKYNISRPECHIVIVGFQAHGTLGRRIVDGIEEVKLWGESHTVRAQVHTIGGLSAHADQADFLDWYGSFENKPPLYLVHGEPSAQQALEAKIKRDLRAPVSIATFEQIIDI